MNGFIYMQFLMTSDLVAYASTWLHEYADPDMEVLMELSTPSSGSKGASKRVNISNDPVVGND
jgi:hypothetical protein